MKGEVITQEAKKWKGQLSGKQVDLETWDYRPQQTSARHLCLGGPNMASNGIPCLPKQT